MLFALPMNSDEDSIPAPISEGPRRQRLTSLDALRGFDMFWIVAGEILVLALYHLREASALQGISGFLEVLHTQMTHVDWEGFHFYDLIFPLFVFITGVSAVFSLTKAITEKGKNAAIRKVIVRGIVLYLLGVFYYAGMEEVGDQLRYVGVLQRIAISYLFGGLLFCLLNARGLLFSLVGILVGYWLAMSFIPVPGGEAGVMEEGANLANWVDQAILPGYKWDGDHDPEGILSSIPAIATMILGLLSGMILRDDSLSGGKKFFILILKGGLLIGLGYLWALHFPIIKKLWTSSYVLVAGGYSCLLLAFFYLVIDVWKWSKWAAPFLWIGANPITIYMLSGNIVSFDALANRIVKGPIRESLGSYAELVVAILVIAMILTLMRFLYRRKIFIRV